MHQSFLTYRNFFYLKIALGVCALSSVVYGLHSPVESPNGGTWLGYTLGTAGAGLIGWLAYFGVRRRHYHGTQNLLVAWLSAHVYLGSSLLVVTTLHTGFQLGWNIHSLAYVLTMLTVFSGFYGLYCYVSYPRQLTANRGGLTREAMISEVAELDRECLALADQVGKDAHNVVLHSIEETVLGGTVWDQLFGDPARRSGGVGVSQGLDEIRKKIELRMERGAPQLADVEDQQATAISFLAEHMLADGRAPERLEKIRRLFDLITRKRATVERIQRDIQFQSRLGFWLYLHVPLTVALLAALFAHVFSVFFYW